MKKLQSIINVLKYHWFLTTVLSLFLFSLFYSVFEIYDKNRTVPFITVLLTTDFIYKSVLSVLVFLVVLFSFEPPKRFVINTLSRYFPFSLIFRKSWYHHKNINAYVFLQLIKDTAEELNIEIDIVKIVDETPTLQYIIQSRDINAATFTLFEKKLQKKDISLYIKKISADSYIIYADKDR